ncbi:hypothetical protein WDW86_06910 [Bdellovibrionota bacterium FG-2]
MKIKCIALMSLLSITTSPLFAAETPSIAPTLSGKVFTDIYVPTESIRETTFRRVSSSAWLEGNSRLGSQTQETFSHFSLAADLAEATASQNSSSQLTLTLREAYVGTHREGWEVRAGRQITPWGKSDAINPTDYLSAKNYTLLNPDDELRRKGGTGVLVSWTPHAGNSPFNFTAIWNPIFPQSELLIASQVVPQGVSVSTVAQTQPTTLSNSENAFKVSINESAWDASVSFFRGWNHVPEFAVSEVIVSPLTGIPMVTIAPVFHRVRALGGDASTTWEKWILRFESAYFWTENNDGGQPLIQPSHWDSVLGVERPLGSDFRIQTQFIYRVSSHFAPAADAIAKANALLLGYQDRARPGATLRLSYTHEPSGLEAEVFALGNFIGGDYFLRPKLSYAWSDAFRTTFGADHYAGPEDRPLGALHGYNSVFGEAKVSF